MGEVGLLRRSVTANVLLSSTRHWSVVLLIAALALLVQGLVVIAVALLALATAWFLIARRAKSPKELREAGLVKRPPLSRRQSDAMVVFVVLAVAALNFSDANPRLALLIGLAAIVVGAGIAISARGAGEASTGANQPDRSIAYEALTVDTPVYDREGLKAGKVEKVLAHGREAGPEGLVVATAFGSRFIDAAEIAKITGLRVDLGLTEAEIASQPEHEEGAST